MLTKNKIETEREYKITTPNGKELNEPIHNWAGIIKFLKQDDEHLLIIPRGGLYE